MTASLADMVTHVKEHAADNYNTEGWDYVVETMSDEDIVEVLTRTGFNDEPAPQTLDEAITHMQQLVSLMDERRKSIQAEAF